MHNKHNNNTKNPFITIHTITMCCVIELHPQTGISSIALPLNTSVDSK